MHECTDVMHESLIKHAAIMALSTHYRVIVGENVFYADKCDELAHQDHIQICGDF